MIRNAGRGTRHVTVALLVLAAGCAREKPSADSTAAQGDSTAQPAASSTGTARTDSPTAVQGTSGTKTADAKTSAKQPDTSGKTRILGRDSVRQGPIIGVPSIVDTAKRRPPL